MHERLLLRPVSTLARVGEQTPVSLCKTVVNNSRWINQLMNKSVQQGQTGKL